MQQYACVLDCTLPVRNNLRRSTGEMHANNVIITTRDMDNLHALTVVD